MSLGSLPVIKTLVSRSRRDRVPLTPDMISPPLDDFRHTMHVGRKGEVFGDTSFLSNCHEKQRHHRWNYITKKLRQARWMSPENQGQSTSPSPPPVSPILKNAVSLPLLHKHKWDDERDANAEAWNCISETETSSPYGLKSGYCTMPRLSCSEEPSDDASSQKQDDDWTSYGQIDRENDSVCTVPVELSSSLWHADSMQSLIIDFGPSLMSEILEGINFADTPGKTEGASGFSYAKETATTIDPLDVSLITNASKMEETHQYCDIQVQESKGLACWEPASIPEDMEVDTDSGITGSEQGSRIVTADLWDSGDGDGSEIEM
ncbi:cdc42 effector protein 1-like [Gastrophryne carolinensis]